MTFRSKRRRWRASSCPRRRCPANPRCWCCRGTEHLSEWCSGGSQAVKRNAPDQSQSLRALPPVGEAGWLAAVALAKLFFRLVLPAPCLRFVVGPFPAAVIAARIAFGIALVELRIDAVGNEVVDRAHDLGWRAHDDRVRWDDGAVGDKAVAGHDRILADHHPLHHRGADADQAMVADAAAVQHDPMRDRAIVADDRRQPIADVHHHMILQIAAAADAHKVALGANDGARPETGMFADLDLAKNAGAAIDIGGLRKLYRAGHRLSVQVVCKFP